MISWRKKAITVIEAKSDAILFVFYIFLKHKKIIYSKATDTLYWRIKFSYLLGKVFFFWKVHWIFYVGKIIEMSV